jgi:hypothetical protein
MRKIVKCLRTRIQEFKFTHTFWPQKKKKLSLIYNKCPDFSEKCPQTRFAWFMVDNQNIEP